MEDIRIACVQMNSVMGDPKTNLDKIVRYSEKAAETGAKIVCFPELAVTGSLYEGAYKFSETIPGESSSELLAAAQHYEITIIAGICERGHDGVVYNSLVICFSDGRVERFRKLYIPEGEYPFFREGSEVPVFEAPGCTFGVSICADLNFAELYKLMSVKGAEVIFNANGGGRIAHYGKLLDFEEKARSIRLDRRSYKRSLRYYSTTNAVYFFM